MPPALTEQEVKQIILRELPAIMQGDREVREFILRLSREQFADKHETESRFDRLLDELRRDREEQARKWEENARQWEENNRRWREAWEENRRQREESDRRWEEQAQLNRSILQQEIRDMRRRHDQSIGALGARWGLSSEQSFRNALRVL